MNTWTFAFGWVFACAILGGLIVVAVEFLLVRRKRRRLRAANLYPPPGAETAEDVRKLLEAGHEDMAIRCYQAVHRVNYQQARDQLLGRKATPVLGYGFPFFGLSAGLCIGAAMKNIPLGTGLGFFAGSLIAYLIRRQPGSKTGSP